MRLNDIQAYRAYLRYQTETQEYREFVHSQCKTVDQQNEIFRRRMDLQRQARLAVLRAMGAENAHVS